MSKEDYSQGEKETALTMKLVLIGIPGAGKSTQGNMLSLQLKIPYLSTGHIFRTIATEKTPLGRYVKETIKTGLLIPDDKTLEIVKEYLSRAEYKNGYIIDGFPRTVKQAQAFKNTFDMVIYLELSDKEALWRLAFRNDSLRTDDTVAAIKKRIDIFHQQTKPVINYYRKQKKLAQIDGSLSVAGVNREIVASLGSVLTSKKGNSSKKKKKTIIGLVGLSGAGKSQAAHYFAKKEAPVIYFGMVINKYIDSHKLSNTSQSHKIAREKIRKTHGMEAMAKLNEDDIKNKLLNNPLVVIDGIRSWEEYQYLKKTFPEVSILLLVVWASKELRWKRIGKRKNRPNTSGEIQDMHELIELNMAPTIANADYLLVNSGTLSEFNAALEKIYREIYFR